MKKVFWRKANSIKKSEMVVHQIRKDRDKVLMRGEEIMRRRGANIFSDLRWGI